MKVSFLGTLHFVRTEVEQNEQGIQALLPLRP